jgi:hypothetical protein
MLRPDPAPKLLAAALGFLVWGAVAVAVGRGPDGSFRLIEAWDSPLYAEIGLPALAAALLVMGWLWPRGAWRWWLCVALGTAIAIVVFLPPGRSFNLWPLSIVAVLLTTAPLLLATYLGVLAQRVFRPRPGGPPPPRP